MEGRMQYMCGSSFGTDRSERASKQPTAVFLFSPVRACKVYLKKTWEAIKLRKITRHSQIDGHLCIHLSKNKPSLDHLCTIDVANCTSQLHFKYLASSEGHCGLHLLLLYSQEATSWVFTMSSRYSFDIFARR